MAEGDPAEEILRLAAALRCDLVVMGTHGKTGLGRLLTGSVAEEVLRKAVCPVLVVKTPLRPTPDLASGSDREPRRARSTCGLWGAALASAHTRTLVRTAAVEVVRLIVRAGQEIPQHKAKGELIVHCLEGRVAFTALGKTQMLEAGKLLHLPAGEPHALKGIEDASLLLTIVAPNPEDRRHPLRADTGSSIMLEKIISGGETGARPGRRGGPPRRSASPTGGWMRQRVPDR